MLRPSLPPTRDEPRVLEHAEVLRDRGERHGEGCGQLRHGGPAARQASEDGAPGGTRERGEDGVQNGIRGGGLTTLNHVVKRRRLAAESCQWGRASTTTRTPPEGASVMFRRTTRTGRSGAGRSATRVRSRPSTTFIS